VGKQWSEDEAREFFAKVFRGEHHIPGKLKPFGTGWKVGNVYRPSTWDYDELTRLVFFAHDFGVRVEILPGQPGKVAIAAWKRVRLEEAGDSPIVEGHPTLEQAVAMHRGEKTQREVFDEARSKGEVAHA
jgi:hypothetical protein